jgi:hypothetical protein
MEAAEQTVGVGVHVIVAVWVGVLVDVKDCVGVNVFIGLLLQV